MTLEEVRRLASAIARANGHPDHGEYAEKVVAAWDERKKSDQDELKADAFDKPKRAKED